MSSYDPDAPGASDPPLAENARQSLFRPPTPAVFVTEHEAQSAPANRQEALCPTREDFAAAYESYRRMYEEAPVGYLSLDARRVIRAANRTAAELFGKERDVLLGQPIENLAAPEWKDDCILHFRRVPPANAPTESQIEFLHGEKGERFWGCIETRLVFEQTQEIVYQSIVADISCRQEVEQLRRNEKRLCMALEAGGMATWDYDVRTNTVQWDERMYALLGVPPADTGETPESFFRAIHPSDRDRIRSLFQNALSTHRLFCAEFRIAHCEKIPRWLCSRGEWTQPYPDPDKPGRIVGVAYDITAAKESELELQRRVKARTHDLRALARHLAHARESERRRIATGLHDEVNQLLSACQIKLAGLKNLLPCERQIEIAEIDDLLSTAIDLNRDLIFELVSPTLARAGFAEAARELCTVLTKRHSLPVRWKGEAPVDSLLAAPCATCLYQCLRELLYNAARHANASSIDVRFSQAEKEFLLMVADDGNGFDASFTLHSPTRKGGFGLYNIRERIESFGGSLEIESAQGKGARITIRLPSNPGDEPWGEEQP